MTTTTYTDVTMGVQAIGARTDAASTAVDDYTAEEVRLGVSALTEGAVTEDAFQVAAGAAMTVDVGNAATAKKDIYVVPGSIAGQGNYLARLAGASENLTLQPAHATLDRIDEIYLVVLDNAYDAIGPSLPRLAVRQGDDAATAVAPGPDAAWEASALLASIAIPGGIADITGATITDERLAAGILLSGHERISAQSSDPLVTQVKAPTGGRVEFLINEVVEGTLTAAGLNLGGGVLTGDVTGNADTATTATTATTANELDDPTSSVIRHNGSIVAATDPTGFLTRRVKNDADNQLDLESLTMRLRIGAGSGMLLESIAGTDLLKVDLNGNLGVRGTFTVDQDGANESSIVADSATLEITSPNRIDFTANGTNSLRLTTGGTVQALMASTAATTNQVRSSAAGGGLGALQVSTSTERIKRDIEELDGATSAAIVKAYRPSTFYSIADDDNKDQQFVGFTAERVAAADSRSASYGADGLPSGLDTTAILSHLTAAYNHLAAQVAELQNG